MRLIGALVFPWLITRRRFVGAFFRRWSAIAGVRRSVPTSTSSFQPCFAFVGRLNLPLGGSLELFDIGSAFLWHFRKDIRRFS